MMHAVRGISRSLGWLWLKTGMFDWWDIEACMTCFLLLLSLSDHFLFCTSLRGMYELLLASVMTLIICFLHQSESNQTCLDQHSIITCVDVGQTANTLGLTHKLQSQRMAGFQLAICLVVYRPEIVALWLCKRTYTRVRISCRCAQCFVCTGCCCPPLANNNIQIWPPL